MNRGVCVAATMVAALLIILHGSRARAQALETAGGPGASVSVGAGLSVVQAVYGQRDLGGGFAFADFSPHWRFDLEAEARFLRIHTAEQVNEQNYLLGARTLLTSGRERVYLKFLAGDGHIDLPFRYGHGDFLALVPGAGLEMDITDVTTVRILDFEYQTWRNFPFGVMRPYGISTGVSFRLSPIARLPRGVRVRRDSRHRRDQEDEN